MNQLVWLDDETRFPPTHQALDDPNGLLAVGGDLSPTRLVEAYQLGVFPWYSEGQPILWWTPDPRMVVIPNQLHISRTIRKLAKKRPFKITVDHAFENVIRHCAQIPRNHEEGTWIDEHIFEAYCELHHLGIAHSIEAWHNNELVGGLYGVALGKAFFGESMFSKHSGASKMAFVTLALQLQTWKFELIDCQIYTDYLHSFGAQEIPRTEFEALLKKAIPSDHNETRPFDWATNWNMTPYGYDGY